MMALRVIFIPFPFRLDLHDAFPDWSTPDSSFTYLPSQEGHLT